MSKKIPWIASTKVLQLTSLRPPINIEHRSGLLHGDADALSRHPCLPDGCRHCDQLQDRLAPRTGDPTDVDTQPQVFRVVAATFSFPEWSRGKLQDAQRQDGDIGPIVQWFEGGGKRPPWPEVTSYSPATKGYWAQWDSLCVKDGLVFRLWETPAGDATVPSCLFQNTSDKKCYISSTTLSPLVILVCRRRLAECGYGFYCLAVTVMSRIGVDPAIPRHSPYKTKRRKKW